MTRFATEDGAFEIDSLPSQCQVAICHGFYIKPDSRGQGAAHGAIARRAPAGLRQRGIDQRDEIALTERLRQLAGMIPTFPGMQAALRNNDGLAVATVLDAQWPALQFDLGLDRLVVYGSDDASALAQWSVSSDTEVEARLVGLVAMARAQETPQSLLECSPECMHYVAAPMLAVALWLSGSRLSGLAVAAAAG